MRRGHLVVSPAVAHPLGPLSVPFSTSARRRFGLFARRKCAGEPRGQRHRARERQKGAESRWARQRFGAPFPSSRAIYTAAGKRHFRATAAAERTAACVENSNFAFHYVAFYHDSPGPIPASANTRARTADSLWSQRPKNFKAALLCKIRYFIYKAV